MKTYPLSIECAVFIDSFGRLKHQKKLKMKIYLLVSLYAVSAVLFFNAVREKTENNAIAKISRAKEDHQIIEDFAGIQGSWKGSLTYLDYESGKPYTMSADVEIRRIDKTNKFLLINTYPKEKSANSKDTITISEDGQSINDEKVMSRTKVSENKVQIITEKMGKDGNDNKDALIRKTYSLGKSSFSIQKDVRFTDADQWIKRHEYVYFKNK